MNMLLKLLFLTCIAFSASAEVVIPPIPTAKEVNKNLSPAKLSCAETVVADSKPVEEKTLTKCYTDHPFFLEAIMLVSDADFSNSDKSTLRKEKISALYELNKNSISACLNNLLQFSKEQNDTKNEIYVNYRLSEIKEIVNK
jgi:hypothetical protein